MELVYLLVWTERWVEESPQEFAGKAVHVDGDRRGEYADCALMADDQLVIREENCTFLKAKSKIAVVEECCRVCVSSDWTQNLSRNLLRK